MLADAWRDVRYALRTLRKQPGFAAIAIVTLALGIGANTAIFSVVNGVLLRPLPFAQPERLVALWQTSERLGRNLNISPPIFTTWREETRSFESLAAYSAGSLILTGEQQEPLRIPGAAVSAEFFATMGVRPLYGSFFTREQEREGAPRMVAIGHGLWQRRFGGDPSLVGKAIKLSDKDYTVAAILPEGFDYPEHAEVWAPLVFDAEELREWHSHYLEVVARRKADVSLEQAHAEIVAIGQRLEGQLPDYKGFGARAISLQESIVGDVRGPLVVLLAAVGFVLLIACANVANLLLVRSAARRREMAVRVALGAGRARMARQLITESILLALVGGALGVLLALWGIGALRALSPADLPRLEEIRVDFVVLAFAFVVSLLTGTIFGLAPAVQSWRLDLMHSLKEGGWGSLGGPHRLRSVLVTAEVALSLVLLAGAGLLIKNLWLQLTANPGFDPRNVLTADITLPRPKYADEAKQSAFFREVLERTRAIPGVEGAALTSALPLSGSQIIHTFEFEGQTDAPPMKGRMPAEGPYAAYRVVSPDYFRVMRIPLLRGRDLAAQDVKGSPDVILINQAMARRYWPNADPIGKRIRVSRGREPAWREIVGIVGDLRHEIYEEPQPEMYCSYEQNPAPFMRIAVRTAGEPTAIANAARQAVWAVDKDEPVTRVQSMETVVYKALAQPRFYSVLFGAFAAVALALAAVGIYGVTAYSVSRRTQEIGVRMALGARPRDILTMVARQGMTMALLGLVIGLGGALALTRFLRSLLHGVSETDPATFAAVALVLAASALLACVVPALRAARVEPVVALRYE